MSEKIEPALSAEEWEESKRRSIDYMIESRSGAEEYAKVIALANDALHPSDPRKITREWIDELRKWAGYQIDPDRARRMADALESYLPPGASGV